MRRAWLALAGLIASSAFLPPRAEITQLRVIGDRSFYPFEYCEDGSTDAKGILPSQWRLMGQRNGIEIIYSCQGWQDAQDAALDQTADAIGGMIKSPEREKKFSFIRDLAWNPPERFYSFDQAYPKEPDFADLVLKNVEMGVVGGDYAVEYLKGKYKNINLKEFDSYVDVVRAACSHTINVFVMEEAVAAHHLDRFGCAYQFTRSASQFYKERLWSAVPKNNPSLTAQLRKAFAKLKNAELETIASDYKPPPHLPDTGTAGLISWIARNPVKAVVVALIGIYVGLIGILFWRWPLTIYRLSQSLRRIKVGSSDIPVLKYIFLVGHLHTTNRVLNAWLADRHATISSNVQERRTVKVRRNYFVLPFAFDDQRIVDDDERERTRLLSERLKETFARLGARILITGEGGSGKTSLAYWIARKALESGKLNDGIFARPTIPIILEGVSIADLASSVGSELNSLVKEEVYQDVLFALMRRGQILLIIDGFSESDDQTRATLSILPPEFPPQFPLVVTSRRDEKFLGGVALTSIRPLKISGAIVASFLEFQLHALDIKKFTGNRRLELSSWFSSLVGEGEITPLLVVIFAHLLTDPAISQTSRLPVFKSIPDLFWSYVHQLNDAVHENRRDSSDVNRDLRKIAWTCVAGNYRPQSCLRDDAVKAIDADRDRALASLIYLERKLGLIEAIEPARTHVRFALDPLAEYMAAAHLLGDEDTGARERFFNYVKENDENLRTCLGFCWAVIRVAPSQKLADVDKAAIQALQKRIDSLRDEQRDDGSPVGDHVELPSFVLASPAGLS